MAEQRWHLKYNLDLTPSPDGFTEADIKVAQEKEGNVSATDALFLTSIVYPPDGGLSLLFTSLDGKENRELTAQEEFKVWIIMMNHLIEKHHRGDELLGWQKQIVEDNIETVRAYLASREI